MDIVHKLKYIIVFKEPVDYFNVILQKQIDLRLKFSGNERLYDSKFYHTYKEYFTSYNFQKSFLILKNSSDKCETIKYLYESLSKNVLSNNYKYIPNFLKIENSLFNSDSNDKIISYKEFEYIFDLMLEELLLFCDDFKFDNDEQKIINSIIQDENLNSNIEFCGWKDYWTII